jgi:recombination protein RecA
VATISGGVFAPITFNNFYATAPDSGHLHENPDIVLILLGTNDLSSVSATTYKTYIADIVSGVIARGGIPFLSYVPPYYTNESSGAQVYQTETEAYNAKLVELAGETGAYIGPDIYSAMKNYTTLLGQSAMYNGAVHFEELGFSAIANEWMNTLMLTGGNTTMPIEGISTGVMPLDIALGGKGIPKGRIVEIYGPEASGKTTLCLSLIAEVQKAGGTAAFIDAEHALDPQWAGTMGVKLEELLISQPDNGEQALEICETLIRSGAVDLIVVDSVAALVPRAEIEGEMGDAQMGLHARLMSQALRKLTGVVSKSKTIVLFTNQLRLKIGVMFGNPETTTGGMALKFYASVRMDVRKIETMKKNNEIIGTRVRVKVVKNKIAPPFREAEFVINSKGIDRLEALIESAIGAQILQRSGSFIKYQDKTLGQGREQVKEILMQDDKLRMDLLKAVREKFKGNAAPGPVTKQPDDEEEGDNEE